LNPLYAVIVGFGFGREKTMSRVENPDRTDTGDDWYDAAAEQYHFTRPPLLKKHRLLMIIPFPSEYVFTSESEPES
jgi:hypothetical protein